MSVARNGALGLGMGALIGAFWWFSWEPLAHSLALLVLSHALAGAAFGAVTSRLMPRWRSAESAGLGVLGGLLLGPLLVVMPFAWGGLAGASGLVAIAAAMAFAALLGLEAGRRGAPGMVGVGLVIVGVTWLNASGTREREAWANMAAEQVVRDFPQQPVAILGIDGADERVLSPMLERGELPNLAALIARGRRGVLRSIEPTLSPVVWTTLFSGHPAEVHGLQSWSTSDNRNRRVPMLWDLFGAHDRSSLVVNVPGTWPPAPVVLGRVLAGFPIPGIVSGGRGQLTGMILSSLPGDEGPIETIPLEVSDFLEVSDALEVPDALEVSDILEVSDDGRFDFDLALAAPLLRPRVAGVSHPLIEAAARDRLIPIDSIRFRGTLAFADGKVQLSAEGLTRPVELPLDAWSDWLRLALPSEVAFVRARVLQAGPDHLQVYWTPAFQNPLRPRYAFASAVPSETLRSLAAPYIVEGVGWRAHRDERIAAFLPEIMRDIERVHADAALALLAEEEPDLFAYVITLTDRIQHPFWRDHQPEAFASQPSRRADATVVAAFVPHAGLDGRDPVADAYRTADGLIGEFLAALAPDALVFVVSDHGVSAAVEEGEGGHRVEGIWIAAGPGIEPATATEELSILDLIPTLLHCLGAPAGRDMPGRVAASLCPEAGPETRIASYRSQASVDAGTRLDEVVEIDASREEQLRSLGYIE